MSSKLSAIKTAFYLFQAGFDGGDEVQKFWGGLECGCSELNHMLSKPHKQMAKVLAFLEWGWLTLDSSRWAKTQSANQGQGNTEEQPTR